MKKFLRSIFKGTTQEDSRTPGESTSSEPESPSPAASPLSTEAPSGRAAGTRPDGPLELGAVIEELRAFICSTIPDPMDPDEVDPMMHLYDAGYVTSITAADLLAHIESRYGLDVSETQLIGRLQNLDALARHIVSPEH